MKAFKIFLNLLFFVASTAQAKEISEYFKDFDAAYKEPFGKNMMQMRNRRITYNQWTKTGGAYIFQAAFRSDKAKALLAEHGMYTGNLFSTNYYELRAEFLKGDPNADNLGSEDNLESLIAVAKENPAVMQRAEQMVLNWNLEKLYINKNPNGRIASSFRERGVAGAEYEQQYGQDFVNFYVTTSVDNLQLMPIIRLVDSSSLVSSNNFTKIRDRATQLYETYRPGGAKAGYVNKSQLAQIKDIRDSIHNQLTPEIVQVIDAYMAKTRPSQGHTELNQIKALIESYFARGIVDILHVARKDSIEVKSLRALDTSKPSLESLTAYTNELVENRKAMLTDTVAVDKKYVHLVYVSTAASFVFEKTRRYISQNRINGDNIEELSQVIAKLLYLQGLISEENMDSIVDVPANFDDYEVVVDNLLTVVMENIDVAYYEYTEKWKQVDKAMGGIVDDTIRSSALALFNHILDKMD